MIQPTHNISQLPKSLQPQKSEQLVVSDESLRLLLANDLVSVAQNQIDACKLPYIIVTNPTTGTPELKDALTGTDLWLKKFITVDEETLAMKSIVPKLAKCPDEVLVHGETGTG